MNLFNAESIEIDKGKLETIKYRVIYEEKNNVKTKSKGSNDMVEVLRKIILEEVNKKY